MNAEEDFARQGYKPQSLVVLLQVTCIDWLWLLDPIHVFQDYRSSRKVLLDNKRTAPVGPELVAGVREMDGSQY